MNNEQQQNQHWAENIIIADAGYLDNVAFNLIVNFERMINRQIPPADLAHWLDCIALDGGVREGENEVQVVLVHAKGKKAFDNFQPAVFDDVNGMAFRDHLGEFCITCVEQEDIVSREQLMSDIVGAACIQPNVKRVMVIPESEQTQTYDLLRSALKHVDDDSKRITLFAMQPMPGGNFRQEILGYSLMSALGIKGEEIKTI